MMNREIKLAIEAVIKEVAQAQNIVLPVLTDDLEIVDDLGFTSLAVATLIANLEELLGIDPFQNEDIAITDIRTLADLYSAYSQCLVPANP